MQNETKDGLELDVKAIDDQGGFEGFASVFGETDSFGDVVAKGAFAKSIKDAKRDGRWPALLWQHNTSQVLGKFTSMVETTRGLLVKGRFTKGVQVADEALKLLRDGAVSGLSIGFQVRENGSTVIDRSKAGRNLTDLKLFEVSVVSFPALDSARVSHVKSGDPKFIERTLRDAGLSRADAKRIVSQGVQTNSAAREATAVAVSKMVTDLQAQTVNLNRTSKG